MCILVVSIYTVVLFKVKPTSKTLNTHINENKNRNKNKFISTICTFHRVLLPRSPNDIQIFISTA